MLKGVLRAATISPEETYLQYRGCGSSKELQWQGAVLSLGCCDTAFLSVKAAKNDSFEMVVTVVSR